MPKTKTSQSSFETQYSHARRGSKSPKNSGRSLAMDETQCGCASSESPSQSSATPIGTDHTSNDTQLPNVSSSRAKPATSRKRKTLHQLTPTHPVSDSSEPLGEGTTRTRLAPADVVSSLPQTIDALRQYRVFRQAVVKQQRSINSQALGNLRHFLGFRHDLNDKERKAINQKAQDIWDHIQGHVGNNSTSEDIALLIATGPRPLPKGTEQEQAILQVVFAHLLTSVQNLRVIEAQRASYEKDMRKLAQKLPVWPWVQSIKGLAELGIALIIGEAGNDLRAFANPAKLWKRMGVGLVGQERQRKIADADQARLHGYSPRRRSTLYTIGDALIKKQNQYRDLYLERKAYETQAHPEFKPIHRHRRAQRYMEKRLLRDLWVEWHRATT